MISIRFCTKNMRNFRVNSISDDANLFGLMHDFIDGVKLGVTSLKPLESQWRKMCTTRVMIVCT